MSWIRRHLASDRFWRKPDWQVNVKSSELRYEIGLVYYLDPGEENPTSEELGRRIDDCLVEYVHTDLLRLTTGSIDFQEFNSRMGKIEEGMKWDPDYQAFADTLHCRNLRPASQTYLGMAMQYVLYGGKRRPAYVQGRYFAQVLLDHLREPDSWEVDWCRSSVVDRLADAWLDSRDPDELQRLFFNSRESTLAWDILDSNSREVVVAGVDLPKEHLIWFVGAMNGYPNRPDKRPNLPNRPRKLGYMLRNNEIRHTVDLLTLVGMEGIDGRSAVADVLPIGMARVRQICKQPRWEILNLAEHAIERLDPSFCLSPIEMWNRLWPCFFQLIRKEPLPTLSPRPKE